MNRIQRVVVWVWLVLMLLCTLFPPWVRVSLPMGENHLDLVYVGRSFLFMPPELSEAIGIRQTKKWEQLDEDDRQEMHERWRNESRAYHVIEVGRLLASWVLFSLICFAVVFAFWRPAARTV